MKRFIRHEKQILSSWRVAIPLLVLGLILFFSALLALWSGNNNHLSGIDLARHLCQRSMSASLPGLFFTMWLIQTISHYNTSSYYTSLLLFGSSRLRIFMYCQVQLVVYTIVFLALNFLMSAVAGLIFGIYPWQLLTELNLNSLLAFMLFLFAIGNLAILLSFYQPGHLIILPFFFYWLLESWLVSYAQRQWELEYFNLAPLSSLKAIIGQSILNIPQLVAISIYFFVSIILLHRVILKKQF
ncbi:hypothetical protein J1N10_08675 [Carboxylicivirga sp. A043]|uniref:hypothetical protein n=1 Tax=Carboxylicivirga litoralis TaxID=2816963 RepID=UPI0021CAF74D|nr:hypothetical protein [Carboxylicivirga sp. A043]MCU4156050.1 hypothetical protein [Carboxylicivirga sp. A043]